MKRKLTKDQQYKVDYIITLLHEVAENQHYETSEGEQDSYSEKYLRDTYGEVIAEVLFKQ